MRWGSVENLFGVNFSQKVLFRSVGGLHQALLLFSKASALCDGIGIVVRPFAALTALLDRQRRNEESEVHEESSGGTSHCHPEPLYGCL